MASRSIWKGTLSFGMVCLPVKVYSGTKDTKKETAMVNIHASCGTRLKQPKWCPTCNSFLEDNEKPVKGYEVAKDQYVILTDEELATIPLPTTSALGIEGFISSELEDPRWIKDTYFVMPDKVGNKAFSLFQKAMTTEGVAGISKITFKSNSKETLCLIRPYKDMLILQSLYWPEELKPIDEFKAPDVAVSEKELSMASLLIRNMTMDFDTCKYTNEYAQAFRELIDAKLEGREIEAPVVREDTSVDDLLASLEASLAGTTA